MAQMTSVVKIEYSDETQKALTALYDLRQTTQRTSEALEICWKAIECVPSGYTAWHEYLTTLQKLGHAIYEFNLS